MAEYLGGFVLGVLATVCVWLLWPRRYETQGEPWNLMHIGRMADALQRHEGALDKHERRLNALESER